MSKYAIPLLRLMAAAVIVGAVFAAFGTTKTAMAQTSASGLPPIDLFVYLDNSQTLFSGGADSPAKSVVEMLKAVVREPINGGGRNFLTRGDRVYLYTFGKEVLPFEQGLDGGDAGALNTALDRFIANPSADKTTEIDKLLRSITNNPRLKEERNSRLKVILIASDFLHDASNAAKTNTKKGVCDLLDAYKKTGVSAVDPEIKALQTTVADPGAALPVFFASLVVTPKDSDFKSKEYRTCAMETGRLRPIVQGLQKELGASVIDHDQAKNDVSSFARSFVEAVQKATLPRLTVERGSCRPRGEESASCALTVRNRGGAANEASKATLTAGSGGRTLAARSISPSVSVPPGGSATISFELTGEEARAVNGAGALAVKLEDNGRGVGGTFNLTKDEPKGVIIDRAEAEPRGAGAGYSLILYLKNSEPHAKQIDKLYFNARTDARRQIAELQFSPKLVVPGNGAVEHQVTLPTSADQALFAGLEVVAESSDVGGGLPKKSDAREVKPPMQKSNIVTPTNCNWKKTEGGSAGQIIQCKVSNSNGAIPNTITHLRLIGDPKESYERSQTPYVYDAKIANNGHVQPNQTDVTLEAFVPMDPDESGASPYVALKKYKSITVHTLDLSDNVSEVSFNFKLPVKNLNINSQKSRFVRDEGKTKLILSIKNDDDVTRYINNIKFYYNDEEQNLARYLTPLNEPIPVAPEYNENSVIVTIRPSDIEKGYINPHKKMKVILFTDRDSSNFTSEGADVISLRHIPLSIQSHNWQPGGHLSLRVRNPAPYEQDIQGIIIYNENRSQPRFIEISPAKAIPHSNNGNGEELTIVLSKDIQETFLLGSKIFICPSTKDTDTFGLNKCQESPEYTISLRNEGNKDLKNIRYEISPGENFNLESKSIKIHMINEGSIPNKITKMVMYSPDERNKYGPESIDVKPIMAGDNGTHEIKFSSVDAFNWAYRQQYPKIQFLDLSNENLGTIAEQKAEKITLPIEKFTYKLKSAVAQYIPGSDAHKLLMLDIVFSKIANTPLSGQRFAVTLIGGDGIQKSTMPIEIDFQGAAETRKITWKINKDATFYENASIEITHINTSGAVLSKNNSMRIPVGFGHSIYMGYFLFGIASTFFVGSLAGIYVLRPKTTSGFFLTREEINEMSGTWQNIYNVFKAFIPTSALNLILTGGISLSLIPFLTWLQAYIPAVISGAIAIAIAMSGLKKLYIKHVASRGTSKNEISVTIRKFTYNIIIATALISVLIAALLYSLPQIYTPHDPSSIGCYADISRTSSDAKGAVADVCRWRA